MNRSTYEVKDHVSTPLTPILRLIAPEIQNMGPPATEDSRRHTPNTFPELPPTCMYSTHNNWMIRYDVTACSRSATNVILWRETCVVMCDVTICDVTLIISYYMYVYDEWKVKSDVSDYHITYIQMILPYPMKSKIMTYETRLSKVRCTYVCFHLNTCTLPKHQMLTITITTTTTTTTGNNNKI